MFNLRMFTFRVYVGTDPYGIHAVVIPVAGGCPVVYVADRAFRFALWPIDHVSAAIPMPEFIDRYMETFSVTKDEALGEIYDAAFLEACLEEDEDEYETKQKS